MDVLAIPRTAVDHSLRILRLPFDTTIAVFDREGDKGSAASLVFDRADAAIRGFAGRVLHDERLQQDAKARAIAVDERRQALVLRAEAALRRRQADEQFQDDLETAEERRADAEQRADQQRTRVVQEQQAARRQVAEQTEQRKAATRKTAERAERRIDERAQKARLEQLEKESAVLDSQENAITTSSEAQRLQRAASEAKSKRKNN